jgi:hypothetical protein
MAPSNAAASAMLVGHHDGKIADGAHTRKRVHNEFNGALRGSRVDQAHANDHMQMTISK